MLRSVIALEVTHGVEAAFEAMRPGPSGMEIDTSLFCPANYIESPPMQGSSRAHRMSSGASGGADMLHDFPCVGSRS